MLSRVWQSNGLKTHLFIKKSTSATRIVFTNYQQPGNGHFNSKKPSFDTQNRSFSSTSAPSPNKILSEFNFLNSHHIYKSDNPEKNVSIGSTTNENLFKMTNTNTANHFFEPNMSWNETITNARTVSQYDMNLFQKMVNDKTLKNYLDYSKLKSNECFQELVSHISRTYDYQITGLVTILFTKLFLHSPNFWPESFGIFNCTEACKVKLESDLIKLAECYDMISYAVYLHDTASHLNVNLSGKSLRNLLILMGDYLVVKTFYDVSSFGQIDLYKICVETTTKGSEGESISFGQNNTDTLNAHENNELDMDLSNHYSKSCYTPNQFSLSEEFKSINELINYCYLTSGHSVACSLQSAFYQANFSPKAQMLAFEFGKNVGIAIKLSNQLSAQFVSKLTDNDMNLFNMHNHQKKLRVNHLNISYFAKFPSISIEMMQCLLANYANKAIKLLEELCEFHSMGHSNKFQDLNAYLKLVDNIYPFDIPRRNRLNKLSEKSVVIVETLIRVIKEIQYFNQPNIISNQKSI